MNGPPLSVHSEVIEVSSEELLGQLVREWVLEDGADPQVAERAASIAQQAYRRDGSVSAACAAATRFVGSRTEHLARALGGPAAVAVGS